MLADTDRCVTAQGQGPNWGARADRAQQRGGETTCVSRVGGLHRADDERSIIA
jgi:hypothetical protein